jgi:8-oxo-dGTP pyrophosphatase MutT (NUDIX family)
MTNQFCEANHWFHDRFLLDNGARLRKLLRRSRICADRVWEIPKGHRRNIDECGMDCAIREFYEETGIPRSAYHITRGTHEIDFVEEGVHYHITYYVAITMRDARQRLDVSSTVQIGEVCNMRWVSASEMGVYAPRDIPGHRLMIKYAKNALRNPLKSAVRGSPRPVPAELQRTKPAPVARSARLRLDGRNSS